MFAPVGMMNITAMTVAFLFISENLTLYVSGLIVIGPFLSSFSKLKPIG